MVNVCKQQKHINVNDLVLILIAIIIYQRDTYFVIRGLLLSDLNELAKDMIENLLDFVDTYGFIRKYFISFLVELIFAN